MEFWNMQLHPNDRTKFPPEKLRKLLQDKEIIGIGEEWKNDHGQPDHFKDWMQDGDIVAVRDGGTPVALVRVTGPCVENNDQTDDCWFDLIRRIEILSIEPPSAYDKPYFNMTSCSLQREKEPAFVRFWYNSVEEERRMEELKQLLGKCHNLILTGAPGTGKSFLAMQLANALTGDSRDTPPSKRHSAFVQFHPSYDYTDFVEGLRPTSSGKDGNIGFERKDGIFKEFCKNAISEESSDQKYVFIIDEINRGDIAKIFGELFFAIDPGYRNAENRIPIKTQYQNLIQDQNDPFKDGFYIPDNVYIIGTMNDIDRNVESMDFAVRRRFTWKQIAPEDTQDAILAGLGAATDDAKKRMNRLNAAIRAEKSQLGENFCIGAAYFKKIDTTQKKWDNLWYYHLAPLLAEYVRGLPDAEKMIEIFKKEYEGNQANVNTTAQTTHR